MRNMKRFVISAICLLATALLPTMAEETKDTIFFELTDSQSIIIPREYIEQWDDDGTFINLKLKGDTIVGIAKSHIVSQGTQYKGLKPKMESFKFNNKFNDQLFTDAEGVIDSINGKISVKVGCIGKRLTPSFKVSDGAMAYVNGERQYSKQTRRRFDTPTRYTVAYPKQYLYKITKVKDEMWSSPEEVSEDEMWLKTKVALTADMFSTNAPSNHGEDPANLLDGDHNTFFHSTWGEGTYQKLTWYEGAYYGDGVSQWPYLEVALPEPLYRLKFEYTTRNSGSYAPLSFILQGSNDGVVWDEIKTFDSEKDQLPTGADATYSSPILTAGKSYQRLRLQLTSSMHKNYLVLSEFSLYKVEENPDYEPEEPTLISPAEYKKGFYPYGRDYDVEVDYLTDHPTTPYNVPRIDIWFGDRETWSSSMWIGRYGKTYYEEATIKIDGGGVYPDMEETPMQIKGRGNSTWTDNAWSKNPYRIKFAEKLKPLGMTKGKSWVLLCNKITGSMTTNALAMKVADMVETRGCNHIVPVELYINNQYRGSYNFTEKVGFNNNSVDIADETNAVMLELDTYSDETIYRENTYRLPVKIKEPDFTDETTVTSLTTSGIISSFSDFTYGLKYDSENAQFDVQSVVRAMLVTDLVRNEELMHPKSWFIYNENIEADSLWNLGPVWDFDWSFGYERGKNYYITAADVDLFYYMSSSNTGYPFFRDLLRNSEKVKKEYYRLWTDFIESGKLDELIEYCDEYFEYARPSLEHNYAGDEGYLWGDGKNYATHTSNAKNWLTKRANYIYTHLTKYDLSDDIIEPDEDYGKPDRVDMTELTDKLVNVYTINGILIRKQVPYAKFHQGLMPGIYIVNGKKIAIGR